MKTKYDWSKVHDDDIKWLAKNGYSQKVVGYYVEPTKSERESCFNGDGNIQDNLSFKGNWQDSLEERPK